MCAWQQNAIATGPLWGASLLFACSVSCRQAAKAVPVFPAFPDGEHKTVLPTRINNAYQKCHFAVKFEWKQRRAKVVIRINVVMANHIYPYQLWHHQHSRNASTLKLSSANTCVTESMSRKDSNTTVSSHRNAKIALMQALKLFSQKSKWMWQPIHSSPSQMQEASIKTPAFSTTYCTILTCVTTTLFLFLKADEENKNTWKSLHESYPLAFSKWDDHTGSFRLGQM